MSVYLKICLSGLLTMLLSSGLFQSLLSSQPDLVVNSEIYELFGNSIDATEEQRFDDAIDTANILCEKYPQEPAGALALITIYQSITDAYKVTQYVPAIDSLLDIAVELSKNKIKQDKRKGVNYFYLASAYGSRSVRYARDGEWLAAFRDGTRIKSNLEKALKYEPELFDAYYGLGIYNYWVADKSKIFSRFLTGKKEAIAQVSLAIENARFVNTTACHGLSAIYVNEGDYKKALVLCDSLAARYPDNPTVHHRMGFIYEQLGNWQQARESFERLLEILEATKYQSASYQADCLYHLARCDLQLQEINPAKANYDNAVQLKSRGEYEVGELKACKETRTELFNALNGQ